MVVSPLCDVYTQSGEDRLGATKYLQAIIKVD